MITHQKNNQQIPKTMAMRGKWGFRKCLIRPPPSEPLRSYKDYGRGSWAKYCCKTVCANVPGMAILAGPEQPWPTTPENNGSHFFLKLSSDCFDGRPCLRLGSKDKFCCHSLVGFHSLVAAAQELRELNILVAMGTAFWISERTMVCTHRWTLQKQFSGSSGTWYRTNPHRHALPSRQSIETFSAEICSPGNFQICLKAG